MGERQSVIYIIAQVKPTKTAPDWAGALAAVKKWTPKQLEKWGSERYWEPYTSFSAGGGRDDDDEEDNGGDASEDDEGDDNSEEQARTATHHEPTAEDVRKELLKDLKLLQQWWRGKNVPDDASPHVIGGVRMLVFDPPYEDDQRDDHPFALARRLGEALPPLEKFLKLGLRSI